MEMDKVEIGAAQFQDDKTVSWESGWHVKGVSTGIQLLPAGGRETFTAPRFSLCHQRSAVPRVLVLTGYWC